MMRPDSNTRIETVEMHTGGEPVRIVVTGYPRIEGRTILDKRRYASAHLDAYRRLIIFEPRGHFDMYGVLPVEPDHPEADMAVLFLHNEGYSTMCGHATLALGRFALDRGIVKPGADGVARLNLQCPCGLVRVKVETAQGRVQRTSFVSVPAFAAHLGRAIDLPGKGSLAIDIGYGGAFYAVVPAQEFGLDVRRSPKTALVAAASAVTAAAKAQIPLAHPEDRDLAFLYGTILTDGGDGSGAPSANVCVFAADEVDRSPTGSGVTARLALMEARGGVKPGEMRRFQSVTGAEFEGTIVENGKFGDLASVRVEVAGSSHYTGSAIFTLEADDPLGGGFLLD